MTTAQMDWSAVFDRAATTTAFRDTVRSAPSARAEAADTRPRFSLDDVFGGAARPARPAAPEMPAARPEMRAAAKNSTPKSPMDKTPIAKDPTRSQAAERPRTDRPSDPERATAADPAAAARPAASTDEPARPASAAKPALSPRQATQRPAASDAARSGDEPEGALTLEASAAADALTPDETGTTQDIGLSHTEEESTAEAEALPAGPTAPDPAPILPPSETAAAPEPSSVPVAAALKPPEAAPADTSDAPADDGAAAAGEGAPRPQAQPWQAATAATGHRGGAAPSAALSVQAGAAASVSGAGSQAPTPEPASPVEGASSTSSTEGAPSTPRAVEFAQMLDAAAGASTAPAAGAPAQVPAASATTVPSSLVVGAAGSAAPTAASAAAPVPGHAEAAGAPVPLGAVPMTIALRALQETHRFEIRLDPVDLGRIDVRLDIDRQDGTVRTDLVVDRPATLSLLQRDASALQQALSQAGLDASGGINLSLRDGSGDGRAAGQGQGQQGGGESARGRPDAPRGAARTDAVGAAPAAARTLRLSGIDIRI